jgi:hypothetical protein
MMAMIINLDKFVHYGLLHNSVNTRAVSYILKFVCQAVTVANIKLQERKFLALLALISTLCGENVLNSI